MQILKKQQEQKIKTSNTFNFLKINKNTQITKKIINKQIKINR